MKLKALIISFILLVSNIFMVFGATNEGYGEDEGALGQVVDSYENYNNISVYEEVIVNTTLDVVALNYTSGTGSLIYQNYSTYTKVGADSKLTVSDYWIKTIVDFRRGTEEGYYYDMGAGNIGVFSYDFIFNITDVEAGDTSSRDMGSIFTVNNWVGDQQDQPVGTYDYLSVNIRNTLATDNQYNIRLVGGQNGAVVTNQISALQAVSNSLRYGTIWRDAGGDVNVTIFSDSSRTTQILSLAESDGGQSDAFRYLYGWFAIHASGDVNDWFKGSVGNLTNGDRLGGYSLSGYFTTDDYLNDTSANGTTLSLMTIATIPTDTQIQVGFSNDNLTWVDSEGVGLDMNMLNDGLDIIDLRGLNYTDIYFRYNLTSTYGNITPYLNQSRLITTIGNATGGGSVVVGGGINSATILMLILLLILATGLYVGVKRK